MHKTFVGMNKWGHDASVCLMTAARNGRLDAEIFLKERFTRQKGSSGTLESVLLRARGRVDPKRAQIAENSYLGPPGAFEEKLAARYPAYFDQLREAGLAPFYSRLNPAIRFVTHHRCHAMAAAELSPFDRSLIVVLDGSGNAARDFEAGDGETAAFPPPPRGNRVVGATEWLSVYFQDGPSIRCVHKAWQLRDRRSFALLGGRDDGLGLFYETASHYIFDSSREAGKVMGLAPYGKRRAIRDRRGYYRGLDWKRAFRGGGKSAWESSGRFKTYAGIAASVQGYFEEELLRLLSSLRERFPDRENLILSGGCALNCVANMKAFERGSFSRIHVPVFPSDEGISFGAAAFLAREAAKLPWKPVPPAEQRGNLGPKESVPNRKRVRAAFSGYPIAEPADIARAVAELLAQGKIVGWFQGRSESGPRALGNRSILASPFSAKTKDDLNSRIKGRESFRPYAGSCAWEKAHDYFMLPRGFDAPFMSFAPRIRSEFAERLGAIRHVDGTSRVQTVRAEQDPLFHALIRAFGRLSGVHCVLNTSLNVMGEPIVETVEDARRFFDCTPVDAIAVGGFLVSRG